jgi:hypothetical protein
MGRYREVVKMMNTFLFLARLVQSLTLSLLLAPLPGKTSTGPILTEIALRTMISGLTIRHYRHPDDANRIRYMFLQSTLHERGSELPNPCDDH